MNTSWPFPVAALITLCCLGGCGALATGGAEVSGLSLLHDRRTSEAILQDQRIEMNAAIELDADDVIHNQAHFNVVAYNGKVLITGEAPTAKIRDKVVEIVRRVPGVTVVHNEMTIGEPTSMLSRSNDAMVTVRVKTALSEVKNLPGFDATRVKVFTENGVVFLMGLLHRNEGNVAAEIARRCNGVKRVVKVFEYLN